MSARSSRRELAALALALAACKHAPEADPAKVRELAVHMLHRIPMPAGVRDCKPDELGGVTLTERTLLQLAQQPLTKDPELADWINPPELDAPAARVLADPNADPTAARQAAAQLLAAPSYTLYLVDMVNAPMALGVKDPKIGTISGRAVRYERSGDPTCVIVFAFQDDKQISDWSIAVSNHAVIAPEVAKALRDDLTKQYLIHAPRAAKTP